MNTRLSSALCLAAVLCVPAFAELSAPNHDRDPQPLARPAPDYAFELRKAEIEGAVLVSCTVTAQGNVVDPVVLKSTDRVFEEPTLTAVRKWKFAPAIKEGRAVSVPLVQLVTFEMPEKDTPTPPAVLAGKMKARLGKDKLLVSHDVQFFYGIRELTPVYGQMNIEKP